MSQDRRHGRWVGLILGLAAVAMSATPGAGQPADETAEAKARLESLRKVAREAADQLSVEQAYSLFKNLARGKVDHLKTKALGALRGTAVQPGTDVASFSQIPKAVQDRERVIGGVGQRDFLPAAFLVEGAVRQRSVGRVIFKAFHTTSEGGFSPGDGWGTGFLVSPSLLMTNNHVIESKEFARTKVRIQFNFQADLMGGVQPTEEFDFDPDDFFVTNPALDYTIVRVRPKTEPAPTSADPLAVRRVDPSVRWGHLRIERDPLLFLPTLPGEPRQSLNIVQHPAGRMKEIAIHNNFIDKLTSDVVLYTTDTEHGSSGSPVFNGIWQVVALHSAGGDKVDGEFVNNLGFRMDRIARDLAGKLTPAQLAELGL